MPGRPTQPVVSQQQRRAMYAAEEGKSKLGIPQSVGAEKVNASKGITGLPKKAPADPPKQFTGAQAISDALVAAAKVGAKGGRTAPKAFSKGQQKPQTKGGY